MLMSLNCTVWFTLTWCPRASLSGLPCDLVCNMAAEHLHKKCNVIKIRPRFCIALQPTKLMYYIDNTSLPSLKSIKDLDINMQSDLKFSCHISVIVSKANARCALIHCSFVSKDRPITTKAYTIYVWPNSNTPPVYGHPGHPAISQASDKLSLFKGDSPNSFTTCSSCLMLSGSSPLGLVN